MRYRIFSAGWLAVFPAFLLCLFTAIHGQDTLTLQKAIALAVERNPELLAARGESDANGYDIQQAGKLRNPELLAETENAGAVLAAFSLSQPIELGSKRKERVGAAKADSLCTAAGLAVLQAAVVAETHRRFFTAIGYRKQIDILDTLIVFAESTTTAINSRVEAGRAGKTESLRNAKDFSLLRLERSTLAREYENSIVSLASLWGDVRKDFSQEISGDSGPGVSVPSYDTIGLLIDRSPVLLAAEADVAAAEAQVRLCRAEGVSDLAVSGGYAREAVAGTVENKVLVGASVNLPLWNRNSDAVAAARNRAEAARKKTLAVRNNLNALLSQYVGTIKNLQAKAASLNGTIIPRTAEVLIELRRLYFAGKSSYMELIAAQRELMDARRQQVIAEVEIQKTIADIVELTGQQ